MLGLLCSATAHPAPLLRLRRDGLLGDVVQVRALQLDALDVVAAVELLVDRMGRVGAAAHGQQQDVLARRALKRDGDRDAASLTTTLQVYGLALLNCR